MLQRIRTRAPAGPGAWSLPAQTLSSAIASAVADRRRRWSRRRSTRTARQNCSASASARCLQNVTVSRASHSASAFASVPTTICTDPGFPSAAGARRCGSAIVICAVPSNTRSTMNTSASAYWRHHALRQSTPAHGVSGLGVVRALQRRDTAPRRYHQGWQRCGTTNAHRGCLELSVPGAD